VKLIYEAEQPVWRQLEEIAEQTAKWRDRRGLHIVRPSISPEGPDDETLPVLADDDRLPVANTNRASRRRQRLRPRSAAADSTDRLSSDEADVRMRLQRPKLPLGV
jgi:type IV secretory pathway VirB10-like protein